MSKKRFKRRKQNYIVVVTIILLCLYWIFLIDSLFSPRHPNYEYEFKQYVVSKDERLWDIAEEELKNNTYYEHEDIRQVIYEIQKDNNISGNIYPGQIIKKKKKKDELSNTTDQSVIR